MQAPLSASYLAIILPQVHQPPASSAQLRGLVNPVAMWLRSEAAVAGGSQGYFCLWKVALGVAQQGIGRTARIRRIGHDVTDQFRSPGFYRRDNPGTDQLPRMDRRWLGYSFFASQGLHPGLHH